MASNLPISAAAHGALVSMQRGAALCSRWRGALYHH